MYMLSRCKELFPGSEAAVAHCNFSLRGAESDGDERFVRGRCRELGVPCFVKRFDTAAYASENGISIEMAARDLRYGWFAELLDSEGFDAVATAHNADDNAETLILNLLRGTGSRGLRGMGERILPGGGRLLRPVLSVPRAEIAAYMAERGIPFRSDSSNAENIYKRNKIRNGVFPLFGQINPSFIKTLSEDMARFAQTDDIADDYYKEARGRIMPDGNAISIKALLEDRHWKYLLFRCLEPYGFNRAVTEKMEALLTAGGTISGKTFESADYKAVTTSDRILLLPKTDSPKGGILLIEKPGVHDFKGRRISVKIYERKAGLKLQTPEGELIADASKIAFPLVLRDWREGDWLTPFGMRGRKKLSDLFADLKWSLPQKEAAIVLQHPDGRQGHIGALLCTRLDDSLKVAASTSKILEISLL